MTETGRRSDSETEIEITSAMVEAGVAVLARRHLDLMEMAEDQLLPSVTEEILRAALRSRSTVDL